MAAFLNAVNRAGKLGRLGSRRCDRAILLLGCSFSLFIISAVVFGVPSIDQRRDASDLLEITAVVPRKFPPQYSVDDTGRPTGFAIDVMEGIAQRAGLRVTYLVKDHWSDVQQTLRSGEADIIPNLGSTANRKRDFNFTSPVETFPVSIFVRKETHDINELTDLAGRQAAVIKANVAVRLLQSRGNIGPGVFKDLQDGLFALLALVAE